MSVELKPKTLKRKNVKGLMLKSKPAPPPAAASEKSSGPDLSTLEIGVEFKLDIRAEDLKHMQDLGAGNGGSVSKVMHQATKTIMARKIIHIDAKPTVRKQIVRELHIMHECHSPYIVSFYGAFLNESEGSVVMCMEYMDCGSLDHMAKVIGPIRIDVLGKISEAVVEGLHYLYNEHKILHRDIKPSNILVNSRGCIKLCDFGVSGELINSIANTFVGTSTYMAPERIQGAQYSVKSDVWSLGLTLLELAIGRFPFDADINTAGSRASSGTMGILDLLQRIVHEPAPRLPKSPAFPVSLEVMIEHCLIKDPELRPSPEQLLSEPFMRSAKATNVDLERWANDYLERIGRTSHRNRSSVLIRTALHSREAPRRDSQSGSSQGPAPHAPNRRPSATPSESIPECQERPERHERAAPPPPFPTRTTSHAARPVAPSRPSHDRAESVGTSASIEAQYANRAMPPPPPPSGRPTRPQMNKAYTESTAMLSREAEREKQRLEYERQSGAYARQGTTATGYGSNGNPRELPATVPRDLREGSSGRTMMVEVRDGRASPRVMNGRASPRVMEGGRTSPRDPREVRDPRDGRGSPGVTREMEREWERDRQREWALEHERRRLPPTGTMSTQSNGAPVSNGWDSRGR
ncbi:kinase-like protein [Ascodesmis nigricans]|uniref:Kinase-like protein n=1 Tax=Ascodesmis nigricans TaxID=341454 RepID=A0A4V6RHC7_9PEZI|nr:kinase-like protein [Ascodesmis nigricans]